MKGFSNRNRYKNRNTKSNRKTSTEKNGRKKKVEIMTETEKTEIEGIREATGKELEEIERERTI